MFILLFILIAIMFGLGFLNPIWWVAAAVLIFGLVRYGGGRESDSAYGEYRDRRDRQDRWNRRYSRQRRGRWSRQDRRDRAHDR